MKKDQHLSQKDENILSMLRKIVVVYKKIVQTGQTYN